MSRKQRSCSRPSSRVQSKSVQVSPLDLPGVGIGWGQQAGATLRDLGEEDKKKVARLIHQVVEQGEQLEALQRSHADAGGAAAQRNEQLVERNSELARVNSELRAKLSSALALVKVFQHREQLWRASKLGVSADDGSAAALPQTLQLEGDHVTNSTAAIPPPEPTDAAAPDCADVPTSAHRAPVSPAAHLPTTDAARATPVGAGVHAASPRGVGDPRNPSERLVPPNSHPKGGGASSTRARSRSPGPLRKGVSPSRSRQQPRNAPKPGDASPSPGAPSHGEWGEVNDRQGAVQPPSKSSACGGGETLPMDNERCDCPAASPCGEAYAPGAGESCASSGTPAPSELVADDDLDELNASSNTLNGDVHVHIHLDPHVLDFAVGATESQLFNPAMVDQFRLQPPGVDSHSWRGDSVREVSSRHEPFSPDDGAFNATLTDLVAEVEAMIEATPPEARPAPSRPAHAPFDDWRDGKQRAALAATCLSSTPNTRMRGASGAAEVESCPRTKRIAAVVRGSSRSQSSGRDATVAGTSGTHRLQPGVANGAVAPGAVEFRQLGWKHAHAATCASTTIRRRVSEAVVTRGRQPGATQPGGVVSQATNHCDQRSVGPTLLGDGGRMPTADGDISATLQGIDVKAAKRGDHEGGKTSCHDWREECSGAAQRDAAGLDRMVPMLRRKACVETGVASAMPSMLQESMRLESELLASIFSDGVLL